MEKTSQSQSVVVNSGNANRWSQSANQRVAQHLGDGEAAEDTVDDHLRDASRSSLHREERNHDGDQRAVQEGDETQA